MDATKDKVLPTPPPIQGQPGGVVREREISTSLESPLDPEVAKIVQVNPSPVDEPPVNFPTQTVKIEINEPKAQSSGSSISKAEAQTIIRNSPPDASRRAKAIIIVREEDMKELGSKDAF